jgi:hypothetical protein
MLRHPPVEAAILESRFTTLPVDAERKEALAGWVSEHRR